jgi:SAM-dependent MidA family methyltransferase
MATETAIPSLIRGEIQSQGPISFARFIELALYCPNLGYYERPESKIGKAGDYYTSVSVGPLFGELLAFQFARWLEAIPGQVQLVEAGAHDGRLARDILGALPPPLLHRLEYWIVEPSANRQKWQRQTLNEFAGKVRWLTDFPAVVTGVIFSNELLDSMPFKRMGWDAKEQTWFEWCVTEDFRWARLPRPSEMDRQFAAVLPDGYTWDVNTAATQWWMTAAQALRAGKLCAIDYFLTDDELWRPERLHGTARAYHAHRVSSDLLANPGEQDITAHVFLKPLQTIGERAGLTTEPLVTQATFLTRILQQGARPREPFSAKFKTLTHPEHLGERFKVFIQSRDHGKPGL